MKPMTLPGGQRPIGHCVSDADCITAHVRDLMAALGMSCESHSPGNVTIDSSNSDQPGCVVFYIRLSGDVDQVQQLIWSSLDAFPVIVIVPDDQYPANGCLCCGEFSLVRLSEVDQNLATEIQRAIEFEKQTRHSRCAARHCQTAAKQLTKRQQLVLQHYLEGHSVKQIARLIDMSIRTIETEKAVILQTFAAKSLTQLAHHLGQWQGICSLAFRLDAKHSLVDFTGPNFLNGHMPSQPIQDRITT